MKRLTIGKDGYCKVECFGENSCTNQSKKVCHIRKLYNRLAELEDKLESGQLVELPAPFIEEGKNAYSETTYLVFRSKVETYCPSEDIYLEKIQAEAKLKELQNK